MGKTYSIKSLSMTNHLVRCGHDITGVADNDSNSHFKVFYFVDTPRLREDMSNFKKNNQ